MRFVIGGIVSLFIILVCSVLFTIIKVKSKEESKFLSLFNSLNNIKKYIISCKAQGKTNYSFSVGKASVKSKIDSINELIINYIKIFNDFNNTVLCDYLIETRKKIASLLNSFYSQIDAIAKDKNQTVYTNDNALDNIINVFNSNGNENLSQKDANYFDKIGSDINNFIDEIIVNLITKFKATKNLNKTKSSEPKEFIVWLQKYLNLTKIIPLLIETVFSLGIGLLVNYLSILIM